MSGIYIPNLGLPEDEQLIVITVDGIAMLVGPEVTKLKAEQVVPVPDHGDLIDQLDRFPGFYFRIKGSDGSQGSKQCGKDCCKKS